MTLNVSFYFSGEYSTMSTSEQLRTEDVGRSHSVRLDRVNSKGNRAAKRGKSTAAANISRSGQQLNKCYIYLSCMYIPPPLNLL